MQLFYSQHITPNDAIFDEAESLHAIQVMRLKEGEEIHITDGNGNLYTGRAVVSKKKQLLATELKVIRRQPEPGVKIHLMVSPTKNVDRYEWLVEKATELSVWSITPLITERTIKKHMNPRRIQNIAVSATKQSLQLYVPRIHEAVSLNKIEFTPGAAMYFGYCGEQEKTNMNDIAFTQPDVYILIGPEGDFTPAENEALIAKNCIPVSLGDTRLRTETAAMYAMAVCKLKAQF